MALSIPFLRTLDESIREFLTEDVLDHSESYKCEKCKLNSKAKIKHRLSKLP